MAQITGTLRIDFEAEGITQDQFDTFKRKMREFVNDDLEMIIFDTCSESGFECNSISPVDFEDELSMEED